MYNVSGTNSWGGAITLTADTRINSAAGTLTLSNTINLGGNILYLQGASTNANTASGIISGSGGSIQKVGTGTWLLSGANTFTGGVSLYAGTLHINHAQALGTIAGTFAIGGVGNTVTIDNTSGGSITALNHPMSWNDDFTFTGSNALNLGSGAVTLQESRQVTVSASTLTVGGIINDGTLDLTKAGAGTLSFGSNPVTLNNLSIGAGILVSTSNTLSLAGNYSNGGTFTHNSGTVRFNGGALQTLGGANSTDFFNLTVDNSGAGLSLSLNQTVNGALTLTDGLVATGANTLTIANDAPGAISGGSSGSYVNGNLVRSILGGVNTYTYPVGTATAYAPVTIAFGTGTIAGTLHGFTVDGDHPNVPHPTVPSVNRFWRFTINSGLTTANYGATFNWVLADVDPMFDFTTARCGKYSGGMWTLPTMGARMATSAEITGESGFSDFQIGTSAALPVTWLSFRATLNEDKDVDLLWSTASESNNEGFDIERSANARDWETIAFVPGAGTTSEKQEYQFTDPAYAMASAGAALIYYRLKQRDYDGSFEYSPVRTIELGNQNGIRVYPNPADEEVTISFARPTEVRGTARLYTQNNRLAAEYTIPPQTTDYPVRVAGLPAGIYVLQVVVGNEVWSKRLVVE
ncbi:MAG: T9SS type A sorting domain-containing protein [Saprospirales bacterium]|nr:T9SS type A sorting domain-containing protein [Saprospirales bacterium]